MAASETGEKDRKKGRIWSWVVMAGTITAIIVFAMISISLVTDRLIDLGIQNMAILSRHDADAIESIIGKYNMVLEGIAAEIRKTENLNQQKQMEMLEMGKQMLGSACMNLTLVAEDKTTLDNNILVTTNDELYEICSQEGNNFVCHFKDEQVNAQGESLLIGDKIEPFSLDGHTYLYLVAKLDVNILQKELKLDSYDGQGLGYVIDFEGYFIINEHRDPTAQNISNFFKSLAKTELLHGMTISGIQKKIRRLENFTFQYKNSRGIVNIVSCNYMEFGNWYFVSVVPRKVFSQQSKSLIMLFTFFMAVILVIVIIAVVMFSKKSRNMLAMERKYRAELADTLSMAQSASKAKTTFLNNMSHDIRTPMNAIIGFTALAITHIDNKKRVLGYLEKISKSSNHLLSLINDVLDMSRIESGNVNIDARPENLVEILHGLKDIIFADIRAKQMDLFIDVVDVRDEQIVCDRLRLNQVLLNLVSNALKYTKPGGAISIRVIEKGLTKKGSGIFEFRVKDNGIGMSPEFVKTIFEPFTREKSSTVSGIQGTGLGMAITKNIVDMMGGTITVTSELGIGSEFVVELEFLLQEGCKEIQVIRSLEGQRSLVVDDDMNTCQSVASMLRQIGMRTEWCIHGKEAIARTEEALRMGDYFQVYIIDWLIPDMNGIEIARRIRRIVGDEVPVILLSAYDWSDIEDEAREAGITDFISKPMFLSDLHNKLMDICGEIAEDSTPTKEIQETNFIGKRLLLVEDNELNREIAIEILEEAGLIVETAEDGSIAVDRIKKGKPGYFDAILMDIQMPIMNGYEAAKAIRTLENKELAKIPIIAMTANAFEEDKQAAIDAGMNAHVGKPIDIPVLFDTLQKILY